MSDRKIVKKSQKIKCSESTCPDWSSVQVFETSYCGFHDPQAVSHRADSRKMIRREKERQRLYEIVTKYLVHRSHQRQPYGFDRRSS